jgi:hypothetical protein
MKRSQEHPFRDFLFELLIYSALVVVYLSFVFHFLSDWLKAIFSENRIVYAVAALVLMFAQAVGLERVTTGLLLLIRRRKK